MFSIQSILSATVLLAYMSTQVASEHSMRILLNKGEESTSVGCSAGDVDIIKKALLHEEDNRRLQNGLYNDVDYQWGPFDDPCEDRCVGFPPTYCFWMFCGWVNRRSLQEEEEEVPVPLGHCADEMVVANNALNSVIPSVSNECKEALTANRAFECFN